MRPFGIFDVVPGGAGLLVKRPVTQVGNNEGHPGYIELVLVACALVAVAVSLSLGWWWVAPIVGVIIATYILPAGRSEPPSPPRQQHPLALIDLEHRNNRAAARESEGNAR